MWLLEGYGLYVWAQWGDNIILLNTDSFEAKVF